MTLVLTGVSAWTAVGDDGPSSFAALRAGVAGLAEHPHLTLAVDDPDFDDAEPLRIASVPLVDPDLEGPARLIALASGALRALVTEMRLTRSEMAAAALFVALPEDGPDTAPWQLARAFVPALHDVSGLAPHVHVEVDQSGHSGALAVLELARRALEQKRFARAVVLAVDSYLDAGRIADWDARRRRFRSPRARDGFFPGEAAVALVVEPASVQHEHGREARALIGAPGFGMEPHGVEGDLAPTGKGLTDALRAALAGSPRPDVAPGAVYADLNGESHRALEWGLARTRLAPALDDAELSHPADCIGDVGAASGALLIGLAAHELARGERGALLSTIVSTASTSGHRSAAVVSPAPRPND